MYNLIKLYVCTIYILQVVTYVPLVALQEGVPSVSAEGVDVYPSTRASGSHHKPAVGRPLSFPHVLEQVISEVLGKDVVFQKTTFLRMLEVVNFDDTIRRGIFLSFQKIVEMVSIKFKLWQLKESPEPLMAAERVP